MTQKNSELSFLGTGHRNDNLELVIFTSKHEFMYHNKIQSYRFYVQAKNDNSELGIHLRTNSENYELSLWPLILQLKTSLFFFNV